MNAEMHWTNPGGFWYSEFSVEDQNLLTIYFIFCIFWLVLSVVVGFCIFAFFIKQNKEIDWVSLNLFFARPMKSTQLKLFNEKSNRTN